MTYPTGEQFTLDTNTESGELTATITSVAASLREFRVNNIDLVSSYPVDSPAPMAAGIVLMPWPNRIRDGRWTQNGVTHQLAITEPAFSTAIHGLLQFTEYQVINRERDSVSLQAFVYPQRGYPFLLRTTVHYELVADGIKVTHFIHNLSDEAAPVAVGAHPYLKIGDVPTADLKLRLNVASQINLDERHLPFSETYLEESEYQSPEGLRVGDLDIDAAFASSEPIDGEHRHSLTDTNGRSLTLWGDENFSYLQVFTTRDFPGENGDPVIAIEPMTAPIESFNSGRGLRWLNPGEEWELSWGIRISGFNP